MISFCCIPSKRQNLYPENKNVRFWDYKHNDSFCCIPSKQQNLYPVNKNVRFWDYKHNDIILLHPLKTAKPLSRKQESMF